MTHVAALFERDCTSSRVDLAVIVYQFPGGDLMRTILMRSLVILVLCALVLSIGVAAQAPQGAGGGQGRGGGGGRGPAGPTFTVTSTAWPDGGEVPTKYAGRGGNTSPAF